MNETPNTNAENTPNPQAEAWANMAADVKAEQENGPETAAPQAPQMPEAEEHMFTEEEVVTPDADHDADSGEPVYQPDALPDNIFDSDVTADDRQKAQEVFEETGLKTLNGDQYFEEESVTAETEPAGADQASAPEAQPAESDQTSASEAQPAPETQPAPEAEPKPANDLGEGVS